MQPVRLLVFVGFPASGKSFALRVMEDVGFHTHDDATCALVRSIARRLAEEDSAERIAVGLHPAEMGAFVAERSVGRLVWGADVHAKVVFLEESATAVQGVDEGALRRTADYIVTINQFSPEELRQRLLVIADGVPNGFETAIDLRSFGFKFGSETADMLFDVRFVPNPFYRPELRYLSGRDAACAEYVLQHECAQRFVATAGTLIGDVVPAFSAQGRGRLTVAIGCTGGQHRSVAIAERMAEELRGRGLSCSVHHREETRWELLTQI